jgi:hypothetical protein
MSIWEITETALADLDVPSAAGVMVPITGNPLPDEYMVYFLVSSPPELHADNIEVLRSYRIQVSYYCRSGLADLPDIDGVMVAAGFARGPQRELPYSFSTGHFGLALEYVYTEISDDIDSS